MRERYGDIGPRGMARLVNHSPKSCQTKAQELQISMTKEAISRLKSEQMKARGHKPTEKLRRPFDDVPPEFIKVSSIWRVGHRYKVQRSKAKNAPA